MSTASFACAGTPALGRAPSLASEALPDTRAWAYLVRCADGSLYAGWTTDLARRLRRHKAGQGAKYTKMRGAVTLAYAERCEDKSAALCREAALKKLDKPQKEALAAAWAAEHALKIRLATEADAPAVAELYNWYVRHSTATFQYAPATVEEMRANIAGVLAGAPFLVAETASGRLAGYACAHPYHAREAYAWSVETTIYCSPDFVGQGVGRRLYAPLLALLREQGYCRAAALLARPNPESEAFHRAMGFRKVGCEPQAGFKFGRWLGVTTWWYDLNTPATPAPVRRQLPAALVEALLAKA
ncbi:MAG TPA: GNAT family N-acetyltransferase [Candidatus Gemmiger avicola]|uniref:GNAT family N-acetyltransferase n=1 Tax=Candidatus Gemmiger avicola TaxID=2838605 RepID=A0A9D2M7Z8_9FIRM|nr:GNAT family N-acetyltransferase [Candidatus Gemmiger avicola]